MTPADLLALRQRLQDAQFWECSACRVKPGSPILCVACQNNRTIQIDAHAGAAALQQLSEERDGLIYRWECANKDKEHAQAVLQELREARDAADGELRMVDAILARRPALDLPTRWQNIEKAITVAARADKAEAALALAEQRIRQAVEALYDETASPGEVLRLLQAEVPR